MPRPASAGVTEIPSWASTISAPTTTMVTFSTRRIIGSDLSSQSIDVRLATLSPYHVSSIEISRWATNTMSRRVIATQTRSIVPRSSSR